MTHKKDKQKILLRKKLDPGFKGFRGHQPAPVSKPELKTLTCAACGRKKSVAADTPEEGFVCLVCRESEQAG